MCDPDDDIAVLDLVAQRADSISNLARIAECVEDEIVFNELIETIRAVRGTIIKQTSPVVKLEVAK